MVSANESWFVFLSSCNQPKLAMPYLNHLKGNSGTAKKKCKRMQKGLIWSVLVCGDWVLGGAEGSSSCHEDEVSFVVPETQLEKSNFLSFISFSERYSNCSSCIFQTNFSFVTFPSFLDHIPYVKVSTPWPSWVRQRVGSFGLIRVKLKC